MHDPGADQLRARVLVPVFAVLAAAGAALGIFSCGGGDDTAPPASDVSPPVTSTHTLPVHVEPGKRYLVDAAGNAFLLHIDTAWSLIADLSLANAEQYLEDRRQKGFNAVIVNLLERKFSTNAGNGFRNFYGDPPFIVADDYRTPNEAYFAHADRVIQAAAARGILVLLVPSYLGIDGLGEGWFQPMDANGPARMRDYGRFLGQRYAGHTNIFWVHGGDFDPPQAKKSLVSEIALGIREFDTVSLHSAHGAPGTSALEHWAGESWLQVNNIYTYTDVPAKARGAHAEAMPFFLFESRYENEPEGTEHRVRVQAYQALLSGAMGQAFGNHPIWHFNGNGVFANPSPGNWQAWLNSPGARSMVHVRNLLSARAWWTLAPDPANVFLTSGQAGSGPFDLAVAAKASDGAFALVYVPSARAVTVDLGRLAGPNVHARWFDPAAGTYSPLVTGSPIPASSGDQVFTTPGNNASTSGSYSDWVLVLESAS